MMCPGGGVIGGGAVDMGGGGAWLYTMCGVPVAWEGCCMGWLIGGGGGGGGPKCCCGGAIMW